MAIELTDSNLLEEIKAGVILVDFWAGWCGPCRASDPILKQVEAKYKDRIRVGKMDVEMTERHRGFGVTSLPTFIIFKDGKEVSRFVGFNPLAVFDRKLNEVL